MRQRTLPMNYHVLPVLLATLLGALPAHCAPAEEALLGRLVFSLEKQPGMGVYVSCKLNSKGEFDIRETGQSIVGTLPAQESLRIFEEFEKLCIAAGEDLFLQPPRLIGKQIYPNFYYESPQGKILKLMAVQTPSPPELTDFMRTLLQKLLFHASKNPRPSTKPTSKPTPAPAPAPVPVPAPPIPPNLS